MTEVVGTAYYVAPEVLMGSYCEKCDMWSVGIILYMLLTGEPLFDGEDEVEIVKSIKQCKIDFNSDQFQCLSPDVVYLLKRLLALRPAIDFPQKKH